MKTRSTETLSCREITREKVHLALSRLRKNCVERAISALIVTLERIVEGICCVAGASGVRFKAVRRHYDPDSLRGNSSGHQVSHAHQIVGRTGEGKHPIHLQRSAMPHLA